MTKTRLSIFILIGFLLGLAAPAWAGYQEGIDAYERGDYGTALKEFRPLAEQGHAWAQYNLGVLYDQGHDVPQDSQEALRWYRRAADQGGGCICPEQPGVYVRVRRRDASGLSEGPAVVSPRGGPGGSDGPEPPGGNVP